MPNSTNGLKNEIEWYILYTILFRFIYIYYISTQKHQKTEGIIPQLVTIIIQLNQRIDKLDGNYVKI